MNLPLILLIALLIIAVILYLKKGIKIVTTSSSFQIISCGCKELETDHPGRVEHKSKCRKFKYLNPDLSFKQFMKYEGFDTEKNDWP